jgi:Holliday junction resolvasome RuvABC ATP-dependent DNA helicase subunit
MDDKTVTWIIAVGVTLALFAFGARIFMTVKRKRDAQAQEQERQREEQRQRENELTREIERSREEQRARDKELKREADRSRLGLSSIIGQAELKRRVDDRLRLASSKDWPFPHTLINANDGMGRYAVARAIAYEISDPAGIVEVRTLNTKLDLSGALSGVPASGCLLLQEIDELDSSIVTFLASAVKTGCIHIDIGIGPGARTHSIPLPHFTIIATCRRARAIPPAVLEGFTLEVLDPYSKSEPEAITASQVAALGFGLDPGAATYAANSPDATPGSIQALMQRVKRYARNSALTEREFLSILGLLGVSRATTNTGSGLVDDLKSMSGVDFEEWTAALLRKHGYRVKSTAVVGDHGIDLEIERAGRRVVVQCKRWSETVGEPVLREFYGSMLSARADAGIFVTTSSFSMQAREFVQQKPITLLDLKSLIDLFLYGGAIEVSGSGA